MALADLPTPLQRLDRMGSELGVDQLWIKRDDLSSQLYGGNKPRKLEFLFAHIRQLGRREVLALGGVGSNHAVATSLFCRKLGLQPVLGLAPQPILSYVRTNILVNHACGAKFILGSNEASCAAKVSHYLLKSKARRQPPYVMYFGGSSRLGNLGFVEAGLELAAQLRQGQMPTPRYIFVATGSCGTHAGLLVGLRLAGLPTQVVGAAVVPKLVTNRYVVAWQATRTIQFLRNTDRSIPSIHIRPREIELLDEFCGGKYGRPTQAGKEASALLEQTEGFKLDPTYTAKAFAAMMHYLNQRNVKRAPVLFWHTHNSVDLSRYAPAQPPAELPAPLKRYFTAPLYDPDL